MAQLGRHHKVLQIFASRNNSLPRVQSVLQLSDLDIQLLRVVLHLLQLPVHLAEAGHDFVEPLHGPGPSL